MQKYSYLLSLTLAILFAGCEGTSALTYSSPGFSYAMAHLPYVEDFIVPDVIYENEPFEIILKLSAERDPEMLRGLVYQAMLSGLSNIPYPPSPTGMQMGAWCYSVKWGDELVTDLHWEVNARAEYYGRLPGWPAGTYTVQVISAESPEWGGVTDRVEITPGFEMPYSEHQVTREYTITVLPKEPAAP